MGKLKTYHGETFLEKEDLAETNIKNKVQLEYYTIKEANEKENIYGIEVIKTEYKKNGTYQEKNTRNDICDNSQKIVEIINSLKENKVTPIGLNDVLDDLLKAN